MSRIQHTKKSFAFFPHSLQLFLPVKLAAILRQKLVEQRMLFNSKNAYKCEKKRNSRKSIEKKVCNDGFNNFCRKLVYAQY